MGTQPPAAAIQTCSKCGTALDLQGSVPGTWVACSGCGQPLQVRSRTIVRPKPAEPEVDPAPPPAATSWSDHLIEVQNRFEVTGSPPVRSDARPWRRRRLPPFVLVLALVSAIANATFAGLFLPMSRGEELLAAAVFGGLLGLFVATMSASAARREAN